MRMNIFLLGLLLIIALSANVEAKNSIAEWVYSGDSITFQEKEYFFYLNTQNNGVLVQSESYRQLIALGQCHEADFVQTCFRNISLEDFKYIRFDTSGTPFYGMKMEMNVTGPQLSITSTFNKTQIDLNDKISGTIKIKNTGNRQADTIRIQANFTPGTVIEYCSDCFIRGSNFVWTVPSLNVDAERLITLRLRADSPEDITSQFKSTFNYREQVGNSYANGTMLKMIKPYELKTTHKTSAIIGETINSEISIKNIGSQPIFLSATLNRSNDVSYSGDILTNLLNLQNALTIPVGETKIFKINLKSDKTGNYDSNLNLFIKRDDKQYNETVNLRIGVSAADIDMTLNTGKKAVIAGDTDIVQLELRNTKDIGYRQITVSTKGFFERDSSVGSLDSGQRKMVFSDSIVYPDLEEKKEITTNVSISYQTIYGESKKIERDLKVTVYPLRLAYEIQRTITPQNPAIGELFTVTVRGKKVVDSRVDIDLISDIIEGARRESGSTSGPAKFTTTFEPLYSYTAIRTSENMSINTAGLLRFGSKTADFSEEYVAPAPPIQPTNTSNDDDISEPSQDNGVIVDSGSTNSGKANQQEISFIDRIADWVMSFFRRGE